MQRYENCALMLSRNPSYLYGGPVGRGCHDVHIRDLRVRIAGVEKQMETFDFFFGVDLELGRTVLNLADNP